MTAIDTEIEALEARLETLRAKKIALEALTAENTVAVRRAAVALHEVLCDQNHEGGGCFWASVESPDDPATDWTERDHQKWLRIAKLGIGVLKEQGFEVEPPQEP